MPILHRPYADRELRAARLRLLRLRDELCLLRRDHWHRKYNPNQPRVPSGNAGGGQWTSGAGGGSGSAANNPDLPGFGSPETDTGRSSLGEGWNEDGSIFEQAVTDGQGTTIQSEYAASRAVSFDERQTVIQPDGNKTSFETTGNVQSIYDGGPDGDLVARTIWTQSGPEPDATVQPAFAPLLAAPTILLGGAILFNWQSPLNGSDGQQAVMGFNAREYQPGDGTTGKFDLSFSGRITEEQAELACRRLPEVRELADRAANAAGSPDSIRREQSMEQAFTPISRTTWKIGKIHISEPNAHSLRSERKEYTENRFPMDIRNQFGQTPMNIAETARFASMI